MQSLRLHLPFELLRASSVVSDSLRPHGLYVAYQTPLSLESSMTGVGCHFLLQGLFPIQGSNPRLLCLLHWHVLYHLCHPGSQVARSPLKALKAFLEKSLYLSVIRCKCLLFCSYSNGLFTCFRTCNCLLLTYVWRTLFPKLLLCSFFTLEIYLFIFQ